MLIAIDLKCFIVACQDVLKMSAWYGPYTGSAF